MRVKFHQSLDDLKEKLLVMAGMAEQAIQRSIEAYRTRDLSICELVFRAEPSINRLEREIDQMALDLLAMEQPMAIDLRFILSVIKINGDPADPNAALFKAGSNKGFEAAGVTVAKEYDTPGWSAENAQREAQQAITALGNNGFAGIYAANDETAGGAIAAMKGAGIKPEERPVTGQDSTVAGLQRILAGEQFMTIYKEIEPQATIAAEFAVALAEGEELPQKLVTEEIDNGAGKVPSAILEPIAVTKENVKSTVVADGFVTAAELCTSAYKKACEEAGISG